MWAITHTHGRTRTHSRARKPLIYLTVFLPLPSSPSLSFFLFFFSPLAHKQETQPAFLNFKASAAAHQSGQKRGPVEQLLLQLTIRVTE